KSEGLNDAAFGGCTRGNIRAKQTDKRRHAQGLRQHKGGTCNETKGPRASALSAKTLNSPNATPQPIAPPDKATINDSPTSRLKITPEGNPIERITAISLRRSRMDIAAVFAATSPIATTATKPRNSASFMKIR